MAKTKYDWEMLLYEAWNALETGKCEPTFASLSDFLDVPPSTIRAGFGRYDIGSDDLHRLGDILELGQLDQARKAAVIFLDKKNSEDVNWREFVDLAETTRDLEERTSDVQRHASMTIDTDRPICVMFTADWHLGDRHTDHATWSKDIQFVLDTPNLYMMDLGDDRQNMRSFFVLSGVLSQVLSPKQQALMLRSVVEELTVNDKLLAKVGGNHDEEFDERIFGQALQSYLLQNMKAPRFRNRGLVKLRVGEQKYHILIFHKSRFKSFLRRTHGAMREHQLSAPADIVAGGHDHEPGMEHLYTYTLAEEAGMGIGGETLFIKTGTYQDSDFGWRYFHNGGFPQNYTVVLFPNKKKMVAFTSPEDAVNYANSVSIE